MILHDHGMNTAELNRRIENLLRLGTIAEVDHAARKIRIKTGTLTTTWLPWPADIGRNYKRWRPLRVGTQVLIACISGDPAQAQIIGTLYTDNVNSPSTDENIDLIQFDDGTQLQYDSNSHHLSADCVGTVLIKSPSTVTIDAPDTNIKGKLTVDGLLTYKGGMAGSGGTGATAVIEGDIEIDQGDVTADGVTLKGHTHTGDSGGQTSEPNP